jgi:hypothetical protein
MSIVPRKRSEMIGWFRERIELWTAAGAGIGLTAGQTTALSAAITQAMDDELAAAVARNAAKAATLTAAGSASALRDLGQETLDRVRVFARSQPDPNAIYAEANVPPPAAPGPAAPPGTPTDFRAQLNTDGSIRLTWKAANPSGQAGTVWFVKRKLNNSSVWTEPGAVGEREFTDTTIPSSSGGASYIVQGRRGPALGTASNPFTILFGIDGPGITIAAQYSENEAGKAAA